MENQHDKLQQPTNDPIILMRHIPSSVDDQQPKIYGTRQQAQYPPLHPHFRHSAPGTTTSTTASSNPSSARVVTDDSDPPPPSNSISNRSPADRMKRMPTPHEITRGLNEYVIGQRNVKVALSVGVYNHYKRIFVAENSQHNHSMDTQQTQHSQQYYQQQNQNSHSDSSRFMMDNEGGPTSLSHLKLGQFGSSIIPPPNMAQPNYYLDENNKPISSDATHNTSSSSSSSQAYCEAPGADEINHNSIDSSTSNFGRDVEDCEIEKSNIMLLGPTGSGKVRYNCASYLISYCLSHLFM
jgi:hypothetical protein